MNEPHSERPERVGNQFTLSSLHAFFSLWILSVEKFYDERDKRYEDRFKAQDEKTSLALTGSEKAISKAEAATEKRFDAVNEFRGTLSDQAATLMPRAEAATRFQSYDEKIDDLKREVQSLRESRSEVAATKIQAHDDRLQSNWSIERILSVLAVAAVVIEAVLRSKV